MRKTARSTSNSKRRPLQQLLDDPLAAGLLPEPLEDEGGPDVPGGDGGELSLGVSREQEDGLGRASAREQQGIELAGLLELIESPQGGDDPLSGSAVLPAVLDDLEVGAWCRTSWCGRTWCPRVWDTMIIRDNSGISRE